MFVYSVTLDGPVKYKFMLKTTSVKEVLEKLLVLFVIRHVFEFQLTAVSHVLSELFRITMTKRFNRSVNFAFLDLSVFVILVTGSETLPRQFSF